MDTITANGFPTRRDPAENFGPPDESEINICLEWLKLRTVPAQRYPRNTRTSYGYKHMVERELDHTVYVSNGAFIEAARRLGYQFKQVRPDNPNAVFKMTVL